MILFRTSERIPEILATDLAAIASSNWAVVRRPRQSDTCPAVPDRLILNAWPLRAGKHYQRLEVTCIRRLQRGDILLAGF